MESRESIQAALGPALIIGRELSGGMSRVFVAHDTQLRRDVVVKMLPPELSATVSVERFRREIHIAAQLQHPHIVPILSAGDAGGRPYYTMPLVEGESLRTRLARSALIPVPEATRILQDVARALQYAHEHGVVHRDIKAENVLLTADGIAVITDFGIAKAINHARLPDVVGEILTATGVAIGTPAYMAPEQLAADPGVDHRADIYAWGVLAYELLTGLLPFGRAGSSMLRARMTDPPRPVTELRPEVPSSLSDLIFRCLHQDPDSRPASAEELRASNKQRDRTGTVSLLDAGAQRRTRAWPLLISSQLRCSPGLPCPGRQPRGRSIRSLSCPSRT